jgi:hypothetical protein
MKSALASFFTENKWTVTHMAPTWPDSLVNRIQLLLPLLRVDKGISFKGRRVPGFLFVSHLPVLQAKDCKP